MSKTDLLFEMLFSFGKRMSLGEFIRRLDNDYNEYFLNRRNRQKQISHLIGKKYFSKNNGFICITKEGEDFYKKKKFREFKSPFTKNSPKNLIVIYDIPEENKSRRDWFRKTLQKFDYIMIQRSVWVGPSPLPKELTDYLKNIGLTESLQTFKLSKPYTGKKKPF